MRAVRSEQPWRRPVWRGRFHRSPQHRTGLRRTAAPVNDSAGLRSCLRSSAPLTGAPTGYDYEPNYVEVNGMRLHHLDEGEGQPVLCFHGEPSWSYLYRKMLDLLVADAYGTRFSA